jgi:outer membrane biosynthesis protein TonB
MRTLLVGTLILGLSPLVSGCTTLQAKKAPVELPALDVPPPPPRVVEPAPAPEPPPEPVPDLPPPSAAPPKPRPQAKPTTNEPKPEPPKPEPPPDTTAPAPPAAPPQVPQLRTPQTADGAEAEKNVRATIDRAKSTLGGVNYNGLSNERKKVYNDAKSFIQQAEDASRQGNFVLAQASATKAEVLAKEISGR